MYSQNFFRDFEALVDELFDLTADCKTVNYTVPNYPPSEVRFLKDGSIKILMSLHKFKKEDIEISAKDNKVIVATKADYQEPKENDEEVVWSCSSFKTKPFKNYFSVPESKFDFDAIAAKFENGLLEISIPVKPEKLSKKITIA